MSYTVYVLDQEGETILPAKTDNYTYGTMVRFDPDTEEILRNPECRLNITYNYNRIYRETFGEKGLDVIHNLNGRDAAPILTEAILKLGSEQDDDYWAATPGNAGASLQILLGFALDQPEGVFSVGVAPKQPEDEED